MSRIIVKQLPKNITEEKLKSIFGSKGTITDMQLKFTPDGKFRQFCFIGYRTEEEAQDAIKFYDNTCIQTNRIKVEICATLGGEDKPQSWSKYAKDSKKFSNNEVKEKVEPKKKTPKISKVDEIIGKYKNDPAFQEFMKVHDKNRNLWANDAEMNSEANGEKHFTEGVEQEEEENISSVVVATKNDVEDVDLEQDVGANEDENYKLAKKPISDLEYMKSLMSKSSTSTIVDGKKKPEKATKDGVDLYTIKIHNVPYKIKRQEILKFFKPSKPFSVRLPTNVHGFCYVGFKTEKEMEKAMLKNKSFIKGKQVFFSDFTEKNKISKSQQKGHNAKEEGANAKPNAKWSKQADGIRNEEDISESGHIFFRNLAYTVTEDDLEKLFQKFGPIAEINLPVDATTRQIKGFGTVTFVMPEHALQAFNKLDGTVFHGRLLHLIPGKNKDSEQLLAEDDATMTFKQKKILKLKKNAQQSVSWNTLFLGANAVAEILAKQFETTKEKILDTSAGGSNAAVRMALGETQIVIEMKRFLEENGVHLNAFDAVNCKRSKTIVLAKNLPAGTTTDELKPLFAKFGPIGRLVLPPSGVTALIEYCDPSEARQAFRKLAYSKFKNVPLYLEWAPENTFKTTLSGEPIVPKLDEGETVIEAVTVTTTESSAETANETNAVNVGTDGEDDDAELSNVAPEPNTTLFLRNLNFKTVQDTVYNHFKHLGPIHIVEITKRKDTENPRQLVSMGYGFLQFKKAETAELALKRMQLTNIDGNIVELKRSDRTLKTPITTTQRKQMPLTKQTGTKILVRNIPFQAKANEVRDIFKAFGELRTLRLPLKTTPGEKTHRGFGFVDYLTKSDAKKAFTALSQSTHLYGRRLVLEWASTADEDIDELRKRTAEQMVHNHGNSSAGKRSRKAVFDVDSALNGFVAEDEEDQ